MKTADFWHMMDQGGAQCDLCPHQCKLFEGETGRCKVRGMLEGKVRALSYGMISSSHTDPIEKKPLYHFHPNSQIFSIGGWGCNFSCSFCQNWSISQVAMTDSPRWSAEDVVAQALAANSVGIAFTYNEPLIGFEFVRDCAKLSRERGLLNVLVTNGYCRQEPAAELLPYIDALNIDIKSMDDEFYMSHCGGHLSPVLSFVQQAHAAGCHVEITNLAIPGLNESEGTFRALAVWINQNLGHATPLHISAYRPQHKMTIPATSLLSLERGLKICRAELKYVYLGNVITESGQDTCCPGCGSTLISRRGYSVDVRNQTVDKCEECGRPLEIVMGQGKGLTSGD